MMVLCCAVGTGCFRASSSAPDSFLLQAYRNVTEAPIRDLDEVEFLKVTRRHAEESWNRYLASCGHRLSKAYHNGFVEGFVDYVQAGGTGEPPYLPPFRYRLTPFRSPDGTSLIEEWYAGFRQGAAAAKESGLREFSYVPLPGYAIPKDLNAADSLDVGKPQSVPPKQPVDGSPGEQPGMLPTPRIIPPIKDASPPAPQPRPIPQTLGVPNLPVMPSTASVQQPISIPRAPVQAVLSSGLPQASIPPPEIPPVLIQPLVIPAQAVVRPTLIQPIGATDPWHPSAPRSPGSGTGSN